jgi:rhombotail lipoprotein
MTNCSRARRRLIETLALATLLTGCAGVGGFCVSDCGTRTARSTTLVQYLYPDGQVPQPAVPRLELPLRVGLAFLPGGQSPDGVDEQRRRELLESVRTRFASKPYVAEIVLIPETYLRSAAGPLPIDQVARLYSLDLLALVAYDQVAHRDENALAVSYLTIVGAYLLPGSRHEVHTLVDLAVVDPKTRQLVLRAGGASAGAGTSTLAGQQRELRADQAAGFARAVGAMSDAFAAELERFEGEVKDGRARVAVAHRDPSPGGAGSLGAWGALALAPLLALRRFRPRSRGARASRGT